MANKLRFGIGGIPHTTQGDVNDGIRRVGELGLDHMELEFVHSVFIKDENASEVKKTAEDAGVSLSVHGSYYVNLASEDKKKWHGGISRVAKAAVVGDAVGAKSVTYHSGFFQKKSFDEVYPLVAKGTSKVLDEVTKKDAEIKIAPELTGKKSQFGGIEELIHLVKDLRKNYGDQISLCIDFAHQYARTNGEYNSYDKFMELIEMVDKELGSKYLKDLHIHLSGIEYSDKGERNHLLYLNNLEEYKSAGVEVEGIEKALDGINEKKRGENKFKWKEVLDALKKAGVGGFVVCESPILELDALLMKNYYNSL